MASPQPVPMDMGSPGSGSAPSPAAGSGRGCLVCASSTRVSHKRAMHMLTEETAEEPTRSVTVDAICERCVQLFRDHFKKKASLYRWRPFLDGECEQYEKTRQLCILGNPSAHPCQVCTEKARFSILALPRQCQFCKNPFAGSFGSHAKACPNVLTAASADLMAPPTPSTMGFAAPTAPAPMTTQELQLRGLAPVGMQAGMTPEAAMQAQMQYQYYAAQQQSQVSAAAPPPAAEAPSLSPENEAKANELRLLQSHIKETAGLGVYLNIYVNVTETRTLERGTSFEFSLYAVSGMKDIPLCVYIFDHDTDGTITCLPTTIFPRTILSDNQQVFTMRIDPNTRPGYETFSVLVIDRPLRDFSKSAAHTLLRDVDELDRLRPVYHFEGRGDDMSDCSNGTVARPRGVMAGIGHSPSPYAMVGFASITFQVV